MFSPIHTELNHITGLQFINTSTHLAVSSFDSRVLLFDGTTGENLVELPSPSIPLCLFAKGSHSTYIGCADGSVRYIDYENARADHILPPVESESHLTGVNQLCRLGRSIVASSFEGKFSLVDPRSRNTAATGKASRKIFQMDASGANLTLALAGNMIELYDERNLSQPFEMRDIGLQLQIKDLKCFDGGFASSTVDGRVSMEYYDLKVQAEKRFTFKCHRYLDKATGVDQVFPVNTICFGNDPDLLYTGGSDGLLCLWNCQKRKRTKVFPKFGGNEPECVSVVDVGENDMIAVGTCDEWNGSRGKVYLKRDENPKE